MKIRKSELVLLLILLTALTAVLYYYLYFSVYQSRDSLMDANIQAAQNTIDNHHAKALALPELIERYERLRLEKDEILGTMGPGFDEPLLLDLLGGIFDGNPTSPGITVREFETNGDYMIIPLDFDFTSDMLFTILERFEKCRWLNDIHVFEVRYTEGLATIKMTANFYSRAVDVDLSGADYGIDLAKNAPSSPVEEMVPVAGTDEVSPEIADPAI